MMENEDSVVTSLNELRKLKHERISRQTQSRSVVGTSARAAALAEDPASDQVTPAPVQGYAYAGSQKTALYGVQQSPSYNPNVSFSAPASTTRSPFAISSAGFESSPVQAPPIIQTKTSYKAAAIVAVLLIGAGGAGYMKLQTDTQAVIQAKNTAVKQAEEARNKSVELVAKAEQQAKTNLRQCEDKLKTAMATAAPVAPAAPAAAAAVSPPVEKKPEKRVVAKAASRPSHKVAAAKPSRRAERAEPAAPKSADVPTIAKKKKLDNDPLAGLGKL
jgi:hypothetical protein